MKTCHEIERSIIKTYRKSIWSRFVKGVHDYDLIQEHDKIAVCISGGKDSMLLAKCMQELHRYSKLSFEVEYIVMDPGYNEKNLQQIQKNAEMIEIPIKIFKANIFDYVVTLDQAPCYMCARMRRGNLYQYAKELGCNKIALGHHFDDVIETILLGMLYGGQVQTMMPKLVSDNFEGMELIRPLYEVKEADIRAWCAFNELEFIQCACRFTEESEASNGNNSKRAEMKKLIAQFRQTNPFIESNIFKSVHNVNLKKIIGYHDDDVQVNFLDQYDEIKQKKAAEFKMKQEKTGDSI